MHRRVRIRLPSTGVVPMLIRKHESDTVSTKSSEATHHPESHRIQVSFREIGQEYFRRVTVCIAAISQRSYGPSPTSFR